MRVLCRMIFCPTLLPMSTDKELEREAKREAFARLLDAELRDQRMSVNELARQSKVGLRTIKGWREVGGPIPTDTNRAPIEDALGWKRDAITEILGDPGATFWDLKAVRRPDPATLPVERASELSTDELLIELTRRVGALQTEVTVLREGSAPQDIYRLAANRVGEGRNMEHLEADE